MQKLLMYTVHMHIPYSRKLSGEKTFANFKVLWLFAKVFSAKFGGMTFGGTSGQSVKVFSVKILLFFCKNFLLYGTLYSLLSVGLCAVGV